MIYINNNRYSVSVIDELTKFVKKPTSDKNYLYFQSVDDEVTILIFYPGDVYNFPFKLEISTDGENWETLNIDRDLTNEALYCYRLLLDKIGDYVFIRAYTENSWNSTSSAYISFSIIGGKVMCGGNIMSLLSNDLSVTTLPCNYAFHRLFSGCSSLVTAPELPATTLTNFCYRDMFMGCTSLVTAPELPATTLASACYVNMFNNCSSLVTAPELPATTLASNCYQYMFQNCSSLVTAPELPATTLANNCYQYMFQNCSNLNYISIGATSWNTSYASNWVDGVGSTGTFVKYGTLSVDTGVNGIPSGWTVNNI